MGSLAVAVVRVELDEDLANRGSGTIVQVGSGAPEFHQGRGIERGGIFRAIVSAASADIHGSQIGE